MVSRTTTTTLLLLALALAVPAVQADADDTTTTWLPEDGDLRLEREWPNCNVARTTESYPFVELHPECLV